MNIPEPTPRPTQAAPADWTQPAEPGHTRRNLVLAAGTLGLVVATFGYHTSLDAHAAATTSAAAAAPDGTSAAPGSSPATDAVRRAVALKDGTYTGSSVETRWGAVQVKITVSGGKITSSQAIDYPDENGHDRQINSYAVPKYNAEAVSAQSASIDSISGATVTWQGYTGSLQSALDQARA